MLDSLGAKASLVFLSRKIKTMVLCSRMAHWEEWVSSSFLPKGGEGAWVD